MRLGTPASMQVVNQTSSSGAPGGDGCKRERAYMFGSIRGPTQRPTRDVQKLDRFLFGTASDIIGYPAPSKEQSNRCKKLLPVRGNPPIAMIGRRLGSGGSD